MVYAPPPHGFRTFVIMWLAQSLSVIGSGMKSFAMNVYLAQTLYPAPEQKAELALAFTVLNLGFWIPYVFGGPIAGAWVDRHDRRQVLIATNIVKGLIAVTMFALMISGRLELWVLVCAGALAAAASALHYAAFETSYAMLVADTQLPRANGMMQTTLSIADVISPAIAAFIVGLPVLLQWDEGALLSAGMRSGVPLVIALDALTFFLCAAVLLFLSVPSPVRAELPRMEIEQSLWADVREGAAFIGRRPPLLWLLATFVVANMALAPMPIIVPLLVKFNLAADWAARGYSFETALALLGVAGGIGGVLGGLAVTIWGGLKHRRVYGVLLPMLVGGILQAVYGFSPLLMVSAFAAFLGAATGPLLNAHSQAIWQSHTPREMQGRVFSIRRLIAWAIRPLSTVSAGVLAGILDPGVVVASLGLTLALFCAAQLLNPYLLRVDDHA